MKSSGLLLALCLLFIGTATAQQTDNGKISGIVFGDYYWIAANHNDNLEGDNGFWLRRVYFTYDRNLSDSFSSRVRLEMSSPGDFITNAKLTAVIKDAYLKWKYNGQQVIFGISPTPSFSVVENYWRYRFMEKTPLDLQGYASSRDFGIAAKGPLNNEGTVKYHFMFANGNSNKSETNKGKKVMLSLGYFPGNFVIEAYGDWERMPADVNYVTLQGFAAYQNKQFTAGVQYAYQVRDDGFPDNDQSLLSLFTHFKANEDLTGVLRLDHTFEANPAGGGIDYIPFSNDAEATLIIAGLDYTPAENIHVVPNIESVAYGETPAGDTPDADLIPRMTVSFNF